MNLSYIIPFIKRTESLPGIFRSKSYWNRFSLWSFVYDDGNGYFLASYQNISNNDAM
jgi:hypothetical protein